MASKKQHAAVDFQGAAKITIAGGAGTSGQVLTSGGSGAMTWENAAIIDDGTSSFTKSWSSSKTISYLATFYATLSNGFSNHKYTAAIKWELQQAINESGWSKSATSGAWGASQSHSAFSQASTTGSGTGALFSVETDTGGIPTFTWVSGGLGYAAGDTLTFNDPYLSGESCVLYVSGVVSVSDGVSFTGSTGSMVCNINHELDTEYITASVRDEDNVIEDLGHVPIVTVIDANNVKLEYSSTDYPDVGEDKFVTIIG